MVHRSHCASGLKSIATMRRGASCKQRLHSDECVCHGESMRRTSNQGICRTTSSSLPSENRITRASAPPSETDTTCAKTLPSEQYNAANCRFVEPPSATSRIDGRVPAPFRFRSCASLKRYCTKRFKSRTSQAYKGGVNEERKTLRLCQRQLRWCASGDRDGGI